MLNKAIITKILISIMKLPKELRDKKKALGKDSIETEEAFIKKKRKRKFLAKLSRNKKKNIPKEIYQLKIVIVGINPPIWRRILVVNKSYLSDLHNYIQKYFNWGGFHLHEFYFNINKEPYSRISIEGSIPFSRSKTPAPEINEETIRLCDIFSEDLKNIRYIYDFGDNWELQIILEKSFPYKKGFSGSLCVGGKRAAPPEDCGGIFGYQDILEILKDPTHPQYSEISEWIGDDFDPEDPGITIRQMTLKEIEQEFGTASS